MNYLAAILIILTVFAGWVGIQALSRWFALRHPEFGPPREEGGQCGISCGCRNRTHCSRDRAETDTTYQNDPEGDQP